MQCFSLFHFVRGTSVAEEERRPIRWDGSTEAKHPSRSTVGYRSLFRRIYPGPNRYALRRISGRGLGQKSQSLAGQYATQQDASPKVSSPLSKISQASKR